MGGLFDGVLAGGDAAARVSDVAWLQAMLDAEAALSGAQADVGLVDRAAADAIAAVCDAARYDVAALGAAAVSVGNPAAPLVRAITAQLPDDAARSVHLGATSQDIVDTAAMLVSRQAVAAIRADVEAGTDRLAELAETHRGTVQVGRTLLQQAVPTTFGLVAAGWLTGLATIPLHLTFPVQLGGAAGTLASLGADGPAVLSAMARRLDLTEPTLPWHTDRGPIHALAGTLGRVSAAVGKVAGDIVLLAQPEVGEVTEANAGGSSTMPHKQNPIAVVLAKAAAAQAPGLVATLLAAVPEHQRGAGPWHAEWRPLTELLRSTGSAAYWLRASLANLRVHEDRMLANAGNGALLTERVTTALATKVGRLTAHDAVTECVLAGGDLAARLAAHPALGMTEEEAAALLDPAGYLGSAGAFVDRALAAYRKER